ncbi:MAG: TM0106 family RecB-like putative nuclease, partial [candidate division Zixibacteria bacterium]|nr:TM0106 family RecB-like putative nuclease [candidate division Zixibacteria bacterium]
MKIYQDSIILSATDLCNYLECLHLTTLSLLDLTKQLERDPPDEESQLIMQKGIEHESQWLEILKSQGKRIIELKSYGLTDGQREEKTIEALREGADVIYQPFLASSPFIGYADFLYRTTTPSKLGDYSYEVVDAKLGKHPKPYYVIQLCLYSELLAKHLGHTPERIHIALGDNRLESLYVKDFYHYYSHLKRQMLNHVEDKPETYPEECSHCVRCAFRSRCEKQRLDDDHLSQVANILRRQIKKLKGVDVTTLKGLAKLKLNHIKGIRDDTLKRLKTQAQLQHHKKTTGKDKCVVLTDQQPGKGFNLLPKPDPGDLFYDIEGDPLFAGGLEYLHGVFYLDKNKEKFLNLWAHDHQEERSAFEELIDFFIDRLRRYPEMHIYHYASYEETALKRFMSKYGTHEAEVDHLLRSKVFVDLYKVVRQGIQVSEPSYSLKNLERFYMDAREAEVKTASGSIVWYEKFIETGEQKFLEDIKQYNLEDCKSLLLLQNWLLKLKKKHFKQADTPEIDREDFDQREDPNENQLREFERVLLKGIPKSEADYTPEHRLRKNINDLANFYRREAKPAWWRMFSRQTMLTEELIDDGECIGGLTLSDDPEPFVEKLSTVYTYDFPEQEYKLKESDRVLIADSLVPAGFIYSLEPEDRKIQLKRGSAKAPLPETLDITPKGPINTDPLRDSLWLFIKSFIENISKKKRPYPATLDLLTRTNPRITDVKSGQPLYDSGAASLENYQQLVEKMKDTYLFIQGPPGTGKTYTASHLIVGLMKKGYKIGVTANSHKVIHNLLLSVERRAEESGFEFEGVKKSSRGSEETIYESKFIHSIGDPDEAIGSLPSCNLI